MEVELPAKKLSHLELIFPKVVLSNPLLLLLRSPRKWQHSLFPIPDGVVVVLTDLDTPTKVTTTKKYTKKATPKSQNRIGFGGGPKKSIPDKRQGHMSGRLFLVKEKEIFCSA